MNTAKIVVVTLLAATALLSGCAQTGAQSPLSSTSSYDDEREGQYGVVESIEMDRGNIDKADGSTPGNETAKDDQQPEPYRIRVKMDNGQYLTVTQPLTSDLRVGDRVSYENDHFSRE